MVLVFGAVLWVVDGEQIKPTSEEAESPTAVAPEVPTPAAPPLAPPRRPATSRRRVLPDAAAVARPAPAPAEPRDEPIAEQTPALPLAWRPAVRTLDPPLPHHRIRSALLLVLLVVAIGTLVAAVIGVIASALAFALRSAVTS